VATLGFALKGNRARDDHLDMSARRTSRPGADPSADASTATSRRARLGRACKTAVVVGTVSSALGASLLATSALAMSHAPRTSSPLTAQSVSEQASESLSADVAQLVKQQPYVVSQGLWENYDPVWWRAASGPALAAAMAQLDPAMVAVASRTFDTLIDAHRQPDGSFAHLGSDAQSPDIDTMFFASNLGLAVRALGPSLPAAVRSRWTADVVGAARYLVANGNLAWYTNGNIAIGNALVMALAWKLTGSGYWAGMYEKAIDFAVDPGATSSKWDGLGLVVTRHATDPNWTDGTGYFTEAGASGKAGFDPDYTQVQLNQMSRLYIVTGSRRRCRAPSWTGRSGRTRC
jgi:hypothetical protein